MVQFMKFSVFEFLYEDIILSCEREIPTVVVCRDFEFFFVLVILTNFKKIAWLFQVGKHRLDKMQGAMQSQLWSSGACSHFTGAARVHTTRVNQEGKNPRNHGVRASAEREVKAQAVATPPTLAEDRLVSRVEEREGYWVLKEEFRQGINPSEKVRLSATEFLPIRFSTPL